MSRPLVDWPKHSIGRAYRIPFLIIWDIRDVIDSKDGLSVAVDVRQAVGGGKGLVHPNCIALCLGLVQLTDRTIALEATHIRKVIIISIEIPAVEKSLSFPCTNEVVGRLYTWDF